MATVLIPSSLKPLTQDNSDIVVEGETVLRCMQSLTLDYPQLAPYLFDDKGQLNRFINIYINDKDIRTLQGDKTTVSENDKLSILPSIAGG